MTLTAPAIDPHIEPPSAAPMSPRRRLLLVIIACVVVFIAVRIVIRPLNTTDYSIYISGLKHFWNGESPYLEVDYFIPPWGTFILAPLVNQPLEVWLSLTVTIFVVSLLDQGTPFALLLLLHPIFLSLLGSSNPEWILIGTGLWLLEAMPLGWGRGIAWLFLASKPQTVFLLLIFDGIVALRQRDWKPFVLAGTCAVVAFLIIPMPPQIWLKRGTVELYWSISILFNYQVIGAIVATLFIVAVRWRRREDHKTLGLLLSLVWTPYALEYTLTALLFAMRKANLLRIILYLAGGLGLAYLYWRDFHVNEQAGAAGMLLLAAIMAPSNLRKPDETQTSNPTFSLSAAARALHNRLNPHAQADQGNMTV